MELARGQAATNYDGPVIKVAGVFMAGMATHAPAEPDALVVRAELRNVTDHYRGYPLVLVWLSLLRR